MTALDEFIARVEGWTDKVEREADEQTDYDRIMYCRGQAAAWRTVVRGLRAGDHALDTIASPLVDASIGVCAHVTALGPLGFYVHVRGDLNEFGANGAWRGTYDSVVRDRLLLALATLPGVEGTEADSDGWTAGAIVHAPGLPLEALAGRLVALGFTVRVRGPIAWGDISDDRYGALRREEER